MCDSYSDKRYKATPTIPSLVDWTEMYLCTKCARREIGTKNVKGWKRIHDK